MSMEAIIFYLLSALVLGTGLMAVTTRKIFRSAIYLLASLVGISGLYFWMEVEFIAAVQIVVYVGGIVVLIIFSVFLTQQAGQEMPATSLNRTLWSVLATVFGFALCWTLISAYGFQALDAEFDDSVERIGLKMLDTGSGGFALPFEAVSILLLAAMIGCIVIAMKSNNEQK
jgi:NADH-quinone oxidoreductase subunit J